MSMFKKMIMLMGFMLMLGMGGNVAMATEYVTQSEFNARSLELYSNLNSQIDEGFDLLGSQVSEGLAEYSVAFESLLQHNRKEVDDQSAVALALAAAPDPLPNVHGPGLSFGLGYLHGRATAVAMKYGEADWQVGASISRRSAALSAGFRL